MDPFSTDAILIRRTEYGDHDLIITYFTRRMGRLSVMAKNAKLSVKRFAGALDPFSVMKIHCTWPKRKNRLPILNNVDIKTAFARIRTNAVNTGYASYWLEMVNAWMEEGKQDHELYDLLLHVLDGLNGGKMDVQALSLLFQIRFMSISGFNPTLSCCGICETPIDNISQGRITFDFAEGQLICNTCGAGSIRHGITVSKGTLKQLFWINGSDIGRAERLKFSPEAIVEGQRLLEAFIPCHIGRDMKSLVVLRRLRH
ncbi:DNA replication and repair protein RecO [Desulfocicer vacuolatum DSM 3385]|uniref:DNA repair protein RecO n=1 Tax=Desulfocicer vacuolatum DSM 3385 TaxID=1121400 RepID=A0A1W2BFM3_9BACT|nr:DNA repair protein RecO [Desulfocicer vacuolatum]SMC71813.1 DNA replication and repair protein RecO [Desulfocicer vacuolatum DSM 3385]